VIEGANLKLVTALFVALDTLVLLRMIKPLYHRVAFGALQSARALVPADVLLQGDLAVFSIILEEHGRSAEVPHVMSENTTFGVVAILLVGTPTGLVIEHEEGISIFLLQQLS
jgi:hypothetical protein